MSRMANSRCLEDVYEVDSITTILSYRTKEVQKLCELYTHRVALHEPDM